MGEDELTSNLVDTSLICCGLKKTKVISGDFIQWYQISEESIIEDAYNEQTITPEDTAD